MNTEATSVEVVLNGLRDKDVEIPDYQRDSDQWSDTTKSLFIESVINNLPTPAFFFEVMVDADGFERNKVVDGQQRLTVLNEFFNRKFRLVESQDAPYISPNSVAYAEKTFDELLPVYQQAFKKYRLSIIKLRDLKDMRLEVFRRINQGGTPLSGQDIRLAYYGEKSPSLAFIRLVGVYDKNRQAAQRFQDNAMKDFHIEYPWKNEDAYETWHDIWADKGIARGQTASEMFLWSLIAAQFDKIDSILKNADALANIKVRFDKGIDEVLDVYCAQLQYQDNNDATPAVLMGLKEMQHDYFPHFEAFTNYLWSMAAPRLNVQKHRTAASVIGAAYREKIPPEKITKNQWGKISEFIRHASDGKNNYGIDWPQSKGRWDGKTGYHVQMKAACRILKKIVP
jgi:hypothetical protein